jgi:hypothetical protein
MSAEDPFEDIFKEGLKYLVRTLIVMIVVISFMVMAFFGCVAKRNMNIPEEPTIWAVSEMKTLEYKWSEGFVFYKIIPINPGGINARSVWIVEYPGAFQVGDRVNFQIIPGDQIRRNKK